MFSFFLPKQANPEVLSDIVEEIKNSEITSHAASFAKLQRFVPDQTAKILEVLGTVMVTDLNKPDRDHLHNSVIDLMLTMVTNGDGEDPNRDPFEFLTRSDVLKALFAKMYPLNVNLRTILGTTFLRAPTAVLDVILVAKECVLPMLHTISETKDEETAHLFFRLATMREDVMDRLTKFITPKLRLFPFATAIDFMIASESVRSGIVEYEVEEWILDQPSVSISDIESLVKFFPFLWERSGIIKMLMMTGVIKKKKMIHWIHDMPPHTVELSTAMIGKALDSLLNPSINVGADSVGIAEDACEGYAFIRIYALSFANPNKFTQAHVTDVLSLAFDDHEYIAAAAAQLATMWILDYGSIGQTTSMVRRTACAVVAYQQSPVLSGLFKCLLRALATINEMAMSIIRNDANMLYEKECGAAIAEANWCFPHFPLFFDRILSISIVDCGDAMATLGFIAEYLNIGDGMEAAK